MKKNKLFWLLLICLFPLTACSGTSASVKQNAEESSQLRDPSLKKCLEDGYQLHSIKKYDIVQSYQCVNTINHKKCDSWHYFRGECHLQDEK